MLKSKMIKCFLGVGIICSFMVGCNGLGNIQKNDSNKNNNQKITDETDNEDVTQIEDDSKETTDIQNNNDIKVVLEESDGIDYEKIEKPDTVGENEDGYYTADSDGFRYRDLRKIKQIEDEFKKEGKDIYTNKDGIITKVEEEAVIYIETSEVYEKYYCYDNNMLVYYLYNNKICVVDNLEKLGEYEPLKEYDVTDFSMFDIANERYIMFVSGGEIYRHNMNTKEMVKYNYKNVDRFSLSKEGIIYEVSKTNESNTICYRGKELIENICSSHDGVVFEDLYNDRKEAYTIYPIEKDTNYVILIEDLINDRCSEEYWELDSALR